MVISSLRTKIDTIDEQIVELLSERANLALDIGAAKLQEQLSLYSPEREEAILSRIAAMNHGPLPNKDIREIFALIIKSCRELQASRVNQLG